MQEPGGQGGVVGRGFLQILADHLTLTQLGGQIAPNTLLLTPLRFSDLPTALNLSVAVRGTEQREDSEAT